MDSVVIVEALNKLTPDHKPLWGKMTPQHMVEHLYKTMQASINEIKLDIYSEERKIPLLKRLFFGERELPKEYMNPTISPDLMELEFEDLQSSIIALQDIFVNYEKFFKENPTTKTAHPVFGNLTKDEWNVFHQKHFQHHLSQFGLTYST